MLAGNTFADELGCEKAKVLPRQTHAVHAIDGLAPQTASQRRTKLHLRRELLATLASARHLLKRR